MDFVKVIKNVFKFMLLVIPLGILFTNSTLIPLVGAQATENPYLTTKVGSKILANGLADFVTLPKVSTGGGTQTTASRLGANSAQLMSELSGLGQKFLEKGYKVIICIAKHISSKKKIKIKEYGAEDKENPKKHEKIFTAFDLFFDRCLFIALDRNLISDEQRDELAELLKSQIKTDV